MGEESTDFSGAIETLKELLSGEEGQQQIQNIMEMFGGGANDTPSESPFGGIDTDSIAMMMKLQRVMSIMNSSKDNNQSRLLTALRPFLKPSRQEKVDSAMKLLSISNVAEIMREVQNE